MRYVCEPCAGCQPLGLEGLHAGRAAGMAVAHVKKGHNYGLGCGAQPGFRSWGPGGQQLLCFL